MIFWLIFFVKISFLAVKGSWGTERGLLKSIVNVLIQDKNENDTMKWILTALVNLTHEEEGKPNRKRILYETNLISGMVDLLKLEKSLVLLLRCIRNVAFGSPEDMLNAIGAQKGLIPALFDCMIKQNTPEVTDEVVTTFVMLTANSAENRKRVALETDISHHLARLLKTTKGSGYENTTCLTRNLLVNDISIKCTIMQEPDLLKTIVDNIAKNHNNIILHLVWAMQILARNVEKSIGEPSMDLRLESIRLAVKAVPGVAKVFIGLLKHSNREIVNTAAKFLDSITEGAAIPDEVKELLPSTTYENENANESDRCPICFDPHKKGDTVFWLCHCSDPLIYWHKECVRGHQSNACTQCGQMISYLQLFSL